MVIGGGMRCNRCCLWYHIICFRDIIQVQLMFFFWLRFQDIVSARLTNNSDVHIRLSLLHRGVRVSAEIPRPEQQGLGLLCLYLPESHRRGVARHNHLKLHFRGILFLKTLSRADGVTRWWPFHSRKPHRVMNALWFNNASTGLAIWLHAPQWWRPPHFPLYFCTPFLCDGWSSTPYHGGWVRYSCWFSLTALGDIIMRHNICFRLGRSVFGALISVILIDWGSTASLRLWNRLRLVGNVR